jgi:hypothetical protein
MRGRSVAFALLATVLALPLAASAEPIERVAVRAIYPLNGAGVMVYEDPSCWTQAVVWEGAWMAGVDVFWYVWPFWAGIPSEKLDDAQARLEWAVETTTGQATSAAQAFDPAEPTSWAFATLGHEDLCWLSAVRLDTSL